MQAIVFLWDSRFEIQTWHFSMSLLPSKTWNNVLFDIWQIPALEIPPSYPWLPCQGWAEEYQRGAETEILGQGQNGSRRGPYIGKGHGENTRQTAEAESLTCMIIKATSALSQWQPHPIVRPPPCSPTQSQEAVQHNQKTQGSSSS